MVTFSKIGNSATGIIFFFMAMGVFAFQAKADFIFDNGPADGSSAGSTWNMTLTGSGYDTPTPKYAVLEEFQLTSSSLITCITYESWHIKGELPYLDTEWAIYDALPTLGDPHWRNAITFRHYSWLFLLQWINNPV